MWKTCLNKIFKLKLEHFFLLFSSETSCVYLEVELDGDSVVTQEHIYTAIKFGVDLSKIGDPVEMKNYVLAFIHTLLLQREKINLEQLTDSFGSSVVTTWQAQVGSCWMQTAEVSLSNCSVQPSAQHGNFKMILGSKA